MVGKAFAFVYTEVSPFVVVGLCLLYFVARKLWFAPHVLIFGWLLIGIMLLARVVQQLVQKGWVRWVADLGRHILSKTWIAILLGVERLRNNWFGRVLGILAVANLSLLTVWMYYNVDLLAWIRSTVILIKECIGAFSDPVQMLISFETWKDTVPLLGRFLKRGTVYVDEMWTECELGNLIVLVSVPMVSAAIMSCAVLVYSVWNMDRLWKIGVTPVIHQINH
jgi:hypothetical protein